MIRLPSPNEILLFRKWAKKVRRFEECPSKNLRADDWQELAVQAKGELLVFSPAHLRELMESHP